MSRRRSDDVPLRFEWERVIKRLILPPTVKHVALTLATYGDLDGRNVRPGYSNLIADTCLGRATVFRAMAHLRDLGLIKAEGTANRRRRQAEEYRLEVPPEVGARVASRSPTGVVHEPDQVSHRDLVAADQVSHRDDQVSHRDSLGLTQRLNRSHTETPPEHDHLSDHLKTTRAAEFVDVTTDRVRANGHPRKAPR